MSEQEERETLVREFAAELSPGDGRTIEARIVPYNTPATVGDPPDYMPYTESWLPGAFERQTRAPNRVRVWLNFEHDQGLRGIVGHGVELVERDDALYGTFRVHENSDGDKALQLVKDGLLTGVSLEARPLRSRRVNGIVERVRAHLDKVSLCRLGAYKEAQVLAVRQKAEAEEPEEPDVEPESEEPEEGTEPEPEPEAPAEPEPELVSAERSAVEELLQRVGYQPLLKRAVVNRPWDGSAARFEDDEYERSCLLCREGDAPPKTRCSLPVLEPNGDLNVNALGAAAARLNQLGDVSLAQKASAARKLVRLYRQADRQPPPNVVALASR